MEAFKLFGDLLFETCYRARDPLLEVVLHTNSPLVWDKRWLLQSGWCGGSDDTMWSLLGELDACNVHSGVMFSVSVIPTRATRISDR